MELGKTPLKESNVNALSKAIHPRHGLVWSDGKAIFLGPVSVSGGILQNTPLTRLGEFDNVESVSWSRDIDATTCFMSVVHQNNVTVWKVGGPSPKLTFKQVRKINVKPVQQGVLWNPKCDVLCLFSRDQVSFYFNHLAKKGSYAFPPLVSGKITCGCWSSNGNKLLVCVGSSLLIYTWPNIEDSLSDFTPSAWTLPKSDGNVTAIVPINKNKYVCCVDLPLERLCQNKDVFLMPELPASLGRSDSKDRKREDVLQINDTSSIKENMLNLPRNPEAIINDSSQIIYFQIHDDARSSVRLKTISLHGLISPDLLCVESSGCVIVGSNSQNKLHIFTITDSNLIKTSEIVLGKTERPKGLHCPHSKLSESQNGVLVLVGKPEKKDALFPSATTESQFDLVVHYFPVSPDRSMQHCQSHSGLPEGKNEQLKASKDLKSKSISESALQQVQVSSNSLGNSVDQPIKIHLDSSDSRKPVKNLVTAVDGSPDSWVNLEIEKTNFKDISPKFKNEDIKLCAQKSAIGQSSDDKKASTHTTIPKSVTASELKTNSEHVSVNSNGCDQNGSRIEESKTCNKGIGNLNLETQSTTVNTLEDSLSDLGLPSNSLSTCSDENYEFLEKVVETQKDLLEELQKKVLSLSQLVDRSSVVSETKYQTPEQPDFVKVSCLYENGNSMTRKFLLDCGRLQLDALKQAFKLDYIALIIDDEPMILGANIDGYIPLKFTPGTTLNIIGEPRSNDMSSGEDVSTMLRKDPVTGATKC